MTPDELAVIKARAEAATPGPWEWEDDGVLKAGSGEYLVWPDNAISAFDLPEEKRWRAALGACGNRAEVDAESNALFVAHARADVPALVAEVERLRAALREMRSAAIEGAGGHLSDVWVQDAAEAALDGKPLPD